MGRSTNRGGMTKAGGQKGAGEHSLMMIPLILVRNSQQVQSASFINFPEEIGTPKQPNYMTFRTWKITSAVGGTMGDMNFMQTQSAGIQQIALPIPTGIGTAYGQAWDQGDVNAVQGALARNYGSGFGNTMKDTATQGMGAAASALGTALGGIGEDVQKHAKTALVEGLSAIGDPVQAATVAGNAIAGITSKIAKDSFAGNALAGIGLGVAGKVLGDASSTALGVASFNQTMAFYQGPKFREFNFSYQLIPHSTSDQSKIKQIIDFFKIASAPEQISSGLFRIYELPFVFTINFYGINGEMEHINKIAHCALTSVDVKYGGDRFNTFAGTDAPVQTNLTLSFKEIELVTKIDMEKGY